MKYKIKIDWLNTPAGILGIGFGIYCFVIAILSLVGDDIILSHLLFILALFYGFAYLVFGITCLFTKPEGLSNFIVVGFMVGSYWFTDGLSWILLPLIIIPWIILALIIMMIIRYIWGKPEED